MFPKKFPYEIQVYVSVLSYDGENDADVLGLIGASAALSISDIPFAGPMGAVRVGRINGEFVANPTSADLDDSDLEIMVCGTADSIVSVEGGAHEIAEQDLVDALAFGQPSASPNWLSCRSSSSPKSARRKLPSRSRKPIPNWSRPWPNWRKSGSPRPTEARSKKSGRNASTRSMPMSWRAWPSASQTSEKIHQGRAGGTAQGRHARHDPQGEAAY